MKDFTILRKMALLTAAITLTAAVSIRPALCAQEPPNTIAARIPAPGERPVTPLRGLFYTAAEIENLRTVVKSDPFAAGIAADYLKTADRWIKYSDAEIDALVPPPDALYAYGFAGDPKTDQSWPWFGSGGICDLTRPGTVKSPFTGDIYGREKPGEKFYDDGKGWLRPEDQKRFYLKAIWYAYVTRQFHEAVDNLAVAYMLTGDDAMTSRAMRLLDHMASLRPLLVNKDGAIDNAKNRTREYGFFGYMGNLASKRMTETACAFDLLARSKAAAEPSIAHPEISKFENIRKNYFAFFERGDPYTPRSLQNHATAMFSNVIAQAVLFGNPRDLKYGIEAIYAFLDNCVDRGGEYYEVSGGYNNTGRSYVGAMMILLRNYKPENYENPKEMPQPSEYPYNLQFGNDPRWYSVAVESLYSIDILGRDPNYGDSGRDRAVLLDETGLSLRNRRFTFLRLFHSMTDNPQWKAACEQRFAQLGAGAQGEEPPAFATRLYGLSQWALLPPPPADANATTPTETSVLVPGKLTAVLRSGDGKNRRALFMRGGTANSHGHDDQMALILYDKGIELTGEFGYKLYGRADHLGWGTRAIAHKMVAVDEDLPPSQLYKHCPPANILAFLETAPLHCVEMSNPAQWAQAGVTEYRRLAAIVDIDPQNAYFLDIFRVTGGHTHDYAWNGAYLDPPREDDGFSIRGVEPKPIPDVWTLAALSGQNKTATYNAPNRSWGERLQGNGGFIKNLNIPGENIKYVGWNPPPGNGYGFIWNIRAAHTDKPWCAEWQTIDDKHIMQLHMLNPDGQQVVTGRSATLELGRRHAVVIARRTANPNETLHSRYVTVTQVGTADKWPVAQTQWLTPQGTADPRDLVALRVDTADGGHDIILSSGATTATLQANGARLIGQRGFIRHDARNNITDLLVSHGAEIASGDWAIRPADDAWRARILQVHASIAQNQVTLDTALPAGASLAGATALFNSPPDAPIPYSHNHFYRIESIAPDAAGAILDFGTQPIVIGRIAIAKKQNDGLIETRWPNELASFPETRRFDGCRVEAETAPPRAARIRTFETKQKVRLDDASVATPGETLRILRLQKGDLLTIPTFAHLHRETDRAWTLRANCSVTVSMPAATGARLFLTTPGQKNRPLGETKNGKIEANIPIEAMPHGHARIEMR